MKIINETKRALLLHYADTPFSGKDIILNHPEGSVELDPEKVAGAIYIHELEKSITEEKA